MKFVSFRRPGRTAGFGIVAGGGVVDLTEALGPDVADLRGLLASGRIEAARAFEHRTPDHALDALTLLPPVTNPGAIYCIGVNYAERNAEYRDGTEAPAYPSIFMRTIGSFTGHRGELLRPPESSQLDYEGEIAIVIGRAGRRIASARARDYVAGLTCANEGTVRDWVRHGKFNVTQGKNWARSGALGPALTTADAIGDFDALAITTRVNGELRQHDTTARLAFPFARLIAYLSTFAELLPGDVICTGTPTGAGARFDPPRWLVPGDVVEVEVPGVGTLVNTVADEAV